MSCSRPRPSTACYFPASLDQVQPEPMTTDRERGRVNSMTAPEMPPWPASPVSYGPVVLRRFSASDVPMVRELSTDPYVPLIGTLAPNASQQEAEAYIDRQLGRLAEGIGLSFAIARGRHRSRPRRHRPVAAGADPRAGHGRLLRGSKRPRARPRLRRADGADLLRVEHPGLAPNRALYRAVEHRFDQGRRKSRVRARGPAAKPSGNRRPPPGHAHLRSRQAKACLNPCTGGTVCRGRTRPSNKAAGGGRPQAAGPLL